MQRIQSSLGRKVWVWTLIFDVKLPLLLCPPLNPSPEWRVPGATCAQPPTLAEPREQHPASSHTALALGAEMGQSTEDMGKKKRSSAEGCRQLANWDLSLVPPRTPEALPGGDSRASCSSLLPAPPP